jgi:hypothetical protein
MKSFSWKRAVATFLIIVAIDAVLEFFSLIGPENNTPWEWFFGIPFWIINFPGLPFLRHLRNASDGPAIVVMALAIVFFSALLWAVAAGYLLGRKKPNETLHSTPR